MKYKNYGFCRWLLLAVLALAAGTCYSCSRGQELVSLQSYMPVEEILEGESAGQGSPEEGRASQAAEQPAQDGILASDSGSQPQSQQTCYVHICGAVVNPGVYEIGTGQRVYQVVEQAGGFTREAAADYLNLAGLVEDGMKLIVPTRDELSASPGDSLYGTAPSQQGARKGSPARINLNTATKEELMGLNGIGEARAGDIIRYREEHGGFQKIEDIMKVPGIKDAAFQKIKDKVTV